MCPLDATSSRTVSVDCSFDMVSAFLVFCIAAAMLFAGQAACWIQSLISKDGKFNQD
jgi:hypothetical protein